MWGNGTIDGVKSLLSDEELSRGASLTHSNKFNTVINDGGYYSGVNDDKCVLCNFHDGGFKTRPKQTVHHLRMMQIL